jgi:hypothetical protein
MAQPKTLTERQVEILRWIDDGCPAGRMKNEFHKITAGALRNRGLVTTTGKGADWTAKITKAGREYLAQVNGPNPPVPRGGHVSAAEEFVQDVVAAGGVLRVSRPYRWGPGYIDWERRGRLAEQHRKLPPNTRLTFNVVDGELEIRLEEAPPMPSRPALVEVDVPESVTRYHQVARAFRDATHRHAVSRASLRRAVRVVHAVALEAECRGWRPLTGLAGEPPSRDPAYRGDLQIEAGGHFFVLLLEEDGVSRRQYQEGEVDRYRNVNPQSSWYRDRVLPRGPYDANATGSLSIVLAKEVHGPLKGRQSVWGDRRSWTLEERLPHVFREIEERVTLLDRWDEQLRVERERRAEAERRRVEERERTWRRLMAEARERFDETERAKHLRGQIARWEEAERIRRFSAAAEAAHPTSSDVDEWLAWARSFADRLDPLSEAPTGPAVQEPTADALQPHLPAGWSPWGPESDRQGRRRV